LFYITDNFFADSTFVITDTAGTWNLGNRNYIFRNWTANEYAGWSQPISL